MMSYKREQDMYPDVAAWLEEYLKGRHRRSRVKVFDASRKSLSRIISDIGIQDQMPPEWVSWDIQVDIVGIILQKRKTEIALVECKNATLSLRDLSQLLGYSLIANPLYSFLLSPQGPSDSLRTLLKTFNRIDVLRYHYSQGKLPQAIIIGQWVKETKSLDWGSVITDDPAYLGQI